MLPTDPQHATVAVHQPRLLDSVLDIVDGSLQLQRAGLAAGPVACGNGARADLKHHRGLAAVGQRAAIGVDLQQGWIACHAVAIMLVRPEVPSVQCEMTLRTLSDARIPPWWPGRISVQPPQRPMALRTAGITSRASRVMLSNSRARLAPDPSIMAISRPPKGPVRWRNDNSFSVTVLGEP